MIKAESSDHERSDLNARAIAWFMVGLVIFSIVVFGAIYFFLSVLEGGHTHEVQEAKNSAPNPRLQSHPAADLAVWRMAEEVRLERYEWVDRKAGIIEIPIERAMELTVQRGLPARGLPNEKKGEQP